MMNSIQMILPQVPPALIMIIGGILLPFVGRNTRFVLALIIPIITLMQIWNIQDVTDLLTIHIASFDIKPLYIHPYTHLFASVFAIAAFAAAMFGALHGRGAEIGAAFVNAGSAIGITFAGDFITLFIYFELMAIGSTITVFFSDQPGAMKSGIRYAMIHFLGGLILMTGIIARLLLAGDINLMPFETTMAILLPEYYSFDANAIVIWLILIGILINAAVPPFSAWLPCAYPRSSAFGGVFLSSFTTKAAVFVLLTLFPGAEILVYIGMFMIFYGIVYAMLENDMRKILSYSIINQVGFMLVGIGLGTDLSMNGAAVHAACHIIYKALLFMSAGSVLHMTGRNKCTELGGLYRSMKLTTICALVGSMSISALPLTSGFISKTLISEAAYSEDWQYLWFFLLAASAGVFLHAGIKFPWFVFFNKDSGLKPKDPPLNMQLAMVFLSVLCILPAIPGVAEKTIYKLLPSAVEYTAYTSWHVVSQIQLLLFSALAFFLLLPLLKRSDTITLDFDWFYRGIGRYIILAFAMLARLPLRILRIVLKKGVRKSIKFISVIYSPQGVIAKNWQIGVSVMFMLSIITVYLVVYYLM